MERIEDIQPTAELSPEMIKTLWNLDAFSAIEIWLELVSMHRIQASNKMEYLSRVERWYGLNKSAGVITIAYDDIDFTRMVKGLESQVISEVKMSSDKKEDEGEEDFEDEEITVENDEEIINEEEELREEQ